MQQKVQFCTTEDGVQIAYSVRGNGHPLLLIPGWVSHLELDHEFPPVREGIDELARDFTVIRYDKRGTGLSDRGVTDFGLEARLRDVEAVIRKVGVTRYAVRGVSEGGPVAIAHSVRHPDAVSHLVLMGTYAYLGHTKTTDALIDLIAAEWGLGSATMANIFAPTADKDVQDRFVRYQREAATKADAAAMLRANVETDVRELLGSVRAPTLVIHSETDRQGGPLRARAPARRRYRQRKPEPLPRRSRAHLRHG
jgi:pimeloyl-ACP methyl ester carboxylesterase